MKIQLKELVESQGALQRLRNQPLKVKFASTLKKATKGAMKALTDYYNDRNEIIKTYGTPDKETKQPQVNPGTPEAEEAEAAVKLLLEKEIDVIVHPIPVSELDKYVKEMTANDVGVLEWLINEGMSVVK